MNTRTSQRLPWLAALTSQEPWFMRGDLDGFFGLFIDNLLQLMLIGILCHIACGFPAEIVTTVILPGAAVGLIHAYTLTEAGIENKFGWLAAPDFAAMYALTGLVLLGLHFRHRTEG